MAAQCVYRLKVKAALLCLRAVCAVLGSIFFFVVRNRTEQKRCLFDPPRQLSDERNIAASRPRRASSSVCEKTLMNAFGLLSNAPTQNCSQNPFEVRSSPATFHKTQAIRLVKAHFPSVTADHLCREGACYLRRRFDFGLASVETSFSSSAIRLFSSLTSSLSEDSAPALRFSGGLSGVLEAT